MLPGSHYEDPQFSWRWAVAPAAIGFAGQGLGAQHANDLFVGGARTFLDEGYLFEFKFDRSRQQFAFSDTALADKVDDNDYKFDEGQSESLLAGRNFGIVTNIVTGPDGNLYVTSNSNGAVYRITRAPQKTQAQEVKPPQSTAAAAVTAASHSDSASSKVLATPLPVLQVPAAASRSMAFSSRSIAGTRNQVLLGDDKPDPMSFERGGAG